MKQSIYRFRLADPTIFLEKYRRFRDGEEAGAGEPRRRVLSRNFRSRPRVLEGCNDLFRAVMSRDFGEVDYTDDQALVPGAAFPPGEDDALELDVLDLSLLGEQEEGGAGGQEPPGGPVGRPADPGASGPAPDGEGRGGDAASAPL